ncbi:DUF4058 family protein [Leptothoe spongobia]|uniref:DUF4058 family protein n=1 Tax=Leptothoe spongobia TAU-MAC 1115 TaxID=1967444 RepID=A0A947GIW4_9CYAN|nr:DUF4058 family protein [Leptothoe spongobia]MBT9316014.1 DUF4058 family protein [Leptothoe spongobia TAU-MAC 1115]
MPSPFPGMDPYLENSEIWPEVHSRLIVAIADRLAPALHPNYYAAIEKRTYLDPPEDSVLIGIPDVSIGSHASEPKVEIRTTAATLPQAEIVTLPLPEEVTERYLEIRDTQTSTVITVIEILSPKNKRTGEGRTAYLRKRQQVLTTQTHLVEIDLLRGQTPMPLGTQTKTDYRILVSRSNTRPQAELYGFNLRQLVPNFHLPLKPGDTEPEISLKAILDDIYDRAGYSFRIDYQKPVKPALSEEIQQWAMTLLNGYTKS